MKIRTFITLDFEEKIIGALFEQRDEFFRHLHSLKWERKNKIHLTLKFLGDVEEDIIGDLSVELRKIISGRNKIKLKFSKYGLFYRFREPKILYVGFQHNKELFSLFEIIEKLTAEFGFEMEKRKFEPHLTLLRIRDESGREEILNFINELPPQEEFFAESVSIYSSELLKSGSVYRELAKFKLN